ncbi:MAG: type II secretion system GspH family protein [Chitinispirillales bacterium]|jgi:prepilin-type N-terminal cleavage/methylation domain-containing protein|nr:type II secretion system GspH family protein [Chitinispirillales bacterium]
MENREHKHRKSEARQERRQGDGRRLGRSMPKDKDKAGFTLIEVMVVIFVMGILAAAIISNWSTFMRHQELRSDAITLHKEILAIRARAVQNDDSAYIDAVVGGSACTLKWRYDASTDAAPNAGAWAKKVIRLNKDVTVDTAITTAVTSLPSGNELVKLKGNSQTNYWMGANLTPPVTIPDKNVRIFIDPDTLKNDPTNAFKDGRIVLKSSLAKIKSRYCIQKDSTCMKPEIYQQTKAGGAWKRL